MISNSISLDSQALEQYYFDKFKDDLFSGKDILYINNMLYLTKGNPHRSEGVLLRDKYLEEQVKNWIQERIGFHNIINRYKYYDQRLDDLSWPKHYAIRFINVTGCLAEGKNIFMFFPEAIGNINSGEISDYFGFEFIDSWGSIFDEIILPCMRATFNLESQIKIFSLIKPRLDQIVYLASIFHEIGHRVGFWKISPCIDSRIKINSFYKDILGELSTDIILINFLHEYPEVMIFIFLQRLFWFGRFGFKLDHYHGDLNKDNDAWIGSYLWNKYIESKCITFDENLLMSVNLENLKNIYSCILSELDHLGNLLSKNAYDKQDLLISKWMEENVPIKNNKFVFFDTLKFIYSKCLQIPEKQSYKFFDKTVIQRCAN